MPDDLVRRLAEQADTLGALVIDLSGPPAPPPGPPDERSLSPQRAGRTASPRRRHGPHADNTHPHPLQERADQTILALRSELQGVKRRCLEQVQEAIELVTEVQAKKHAEQHLRAELDKQTSLADERLAALRDAYKQQQDACQERREMDDELQVLRAARDARNRELQGVQERAQAAAAALEMRLRDSNDRVDDGLRRERDLARQHHAEKQRLLMRVEDLESEAAECRGRLKRALAKEADREAERGDLETALAAAQREAALARQRAQQHAEREQELEATVAVAQRKLQAAGETNDALRAAADERDASRLEAIAQLEADIKSFKEGTLYTEVAEQKHALGEARRALAEETRMRNEVEQERARLADKLRATQDAAARADERTKVLVEEAERLRVGAEEQVANALSAQGDSLQRVQDELLQQAEASEQGRAATLQRYHEVIQENTRLAELVEEGRRAARHEHSAYVTSLGGEVELYKAELAQREAELERERILAAEAAEDRARIADENDALRHSMQQMRRWALGVVEAHDEPSPLPIPVSAHF